jgi:CubicO group peptidase (beta-lactamase class C family)
MKSSTTKLEKVKEHLVKGGNAQGQICKNWEFDVLEGPGAVLSTISDMEKFVRAVISQKDEALELQRKPTFKVNENMEMGLGWHIIHGKTGNTFYWHNGGTNGYTSSLIIDTERKLAIIVLSNLSAFHPKMGNIDELTFELMKTLN